MKLKLPDQCKETKFSPFPGMHFDGWQLDVCVSIYPGLAIFSAQVEGCPAPEQKQTVLDVAMSSLNN